MPDNQKRSFKASLNVERQCVNFKIEDEQASKYVYTLTSDNTILEKVLQDLEKIAPVKFEYDEVRKEVTVRMKQDGKK